MFASEHVISPAHALVESFHTFLTPCYIGKFDATRKVSPKQSWTANVAPNTSLNFVHLIKKWLNKLK